MPGLSLCWGNRTNFNVFGDFTVQDGPTTWSDFSTLLAPAFPRSTSSPSNSNQSYISSSSYYGYERVPVGHSFDSMDVDHYRQTNGETVHLGQQMDEAKDVRARCRKRWSSEEREVDYVKRPRFEGSVNRDSRQLQLVSHNIGELGVMDKSDEEDDLLFMEDYLKQTHGCDYYNFECSYL